MEDITPNTIPLIHKSHPDYSLEINHISEQCDMELAPICVNNHGNIIVAFSKCAKVHTSTPKT